MHPQAVVDSLAAPHLKSGVEGVRRKGLRSKGPYLRRRGWPMPSIPFGNCPTLRGKGCSGILLVGQLPWSKTARSPARSKPCRAGFGGSRVKSLTLRHFDKLHAIGLLPGQTVPETFRFA